LRESASLASSLARRQLPAGLMQRLEMMQKLALQAKAEAEGRKPGANPRLAGRLPRRGAQVIVLAWFSLGVVTSGAAGFGTLMGLRSLEAKGTPLTWAGVRASLGASLASAWAKMPSVPFTTRPTPHADGPWERVEVKIDRGKRDAPLGLSVTGGDDRPVLFVLDGLPKGVRPSHGAAVGPATWVVPSADIEVLHLTFGEGAPDAFDLKIALLAPTGVAKSGSVVQVRMAEEMPVTLASKSTKTATQASAGGIGPDGTAAWPSPGQQPWARLR
jgi:hypothetical protein